MTPVGCGAEALPDRQSSIPAELEDLDRVIAIVEDRINTLRARLSPVLNDASRAEEPEKQEPAALAPLAREIRARGKAVQSFGFAVKDMLDRLEL